MKLERISIAISTLVLLFVTESLAQSEGNTARTGASISTYSCNPNVCKLANGCVCASKNPPNGFAPSDTPQFVTVTFDDSIQPQLYKTAKKMLNVTYVIFFYLHIQTVDLTLLQMK
jgi:hypothetical protein